MGQRHAPAALSPRERPVTYCTGSSVVLRAGLDKCGKSRLHRVFFCKRIFINPISYTLRASLHAAKKTSVKNMSLCKVSSSGGKRNLKKHSQVPWGGMTALSFSSVLQPVDDIQIPACNWGLRAY